MEHAHKNFYVLNSYLSPMYLFTPKIVMEQYTKIWQKLKINKLCASKLKIILILVTVFNEFTFIMYRVIFSLSFGVMFYLLINISIGGRK